MMKYIQRIFLGTNKKDMTLAEKRGRSLSNSDGEIIKIIRTERKYEKYYPIISAYVARILSGADELLEYDMPLYIDAVSAVKADIPEDYADKVSYDLLTVSELDACIKRLSEYDDDIQKYLTKEREKEARIDDLETGRMSLSVLGVASVNDLDDALWKQREEKEQQTERKVQSLAAGLSALKGDKSSLASFFSSTKVDEENEKREAREDRTDSSSMDEEESGTGKNPKKGM